MRLGLRRPVPEAVPSLHGDLHCSGRGGHPLPGAGKHLLVCETAVCGDYGTVKPPGGLPGDTAGGMGHHADPVQHPVWGAGDLGRLAAGQIGAGITSPLFAYVAKITGRMSPDV